MKRIKIHATGPVSKKEPLLKAIIRINKKLPPLTPYKKYQELCRKDAEQIHNILSAYLPGGTYFDLLELMNKNNV